MNTASPRSSSRTLPDAGAPYELSISLVVFQPQLDVLTQTIRSLRLALIHAHAAFVGTTVVVWLVDNGSADAETIDRAWAAAWEPKPDWVHLEILRGHGNLGYGRGHNLAIERATGRYHLILNPDAILEPDAVAESMRYLEAHPQVGLVTPHAVDGTGARQWLCKREPSVLVLALRGFGPRVVRRWFARLLDRYEMHDLPEGEVATGIPIASGCYMFTRLRSLQAVGGFCRRYFLYFEDFDLSLRLRRVTDIAYVPQVRIVHFGGSAARKGWRHRGLFVRSAVTFFRQHGWRLW